MLKLIGALAVALTLAACNQSAITVTPQQAVEAVTAVNAIELTGRNYLTWPLCPGAVLCRTQVASANVATGVRTLYAAKNAVLAYLSANPGQPLPVTLTEALSASVVALQALYAKYGVVQ